MSLENDFYNSGKEKLDAKRDLAALSLFAKSFNNSHIAKDNLIEYALTYYNLGFYESSIDISSCIINLDSNEPRVLWNLGKCYHELEDFGEALFCWNRLLKVQGLYSEIYDKRALVYYKSGNLKHYEEDIKIKNLLLNTSDRNRFKSFLTIDELLQRERQIIKDLENCSFIDLFHIGNQFIHYKNDEKAIYYLTESINMFSGDLYFDAVLNRGFAYSDSYPDKAIVDCQTILEADPKHGRGLMLKTMIETKHEVSL